MIEWCLGQTSVVQRSVSLLRSSHYPPPEQRPINAVILPLSVNADICEIPT